MVSTPSTPADPSPTNLVPHSSLFAKYSIALLLLFLLIATGFTSVQNYQLRKKLDLTSRPTIIPSPIIPTPTVRSNIISGWLSYTNNKCGYALEYPSTWHMYPENESALSGVTVITSYDDNAIPKRPNLVKIQIGCGQLEASQTIEEWLKQRQTQNDGYGIPTFTLLEKTMLNADLLYKYKVHPVNGDDIMDYFIFHSKKVVSFSYMPLNSTLKDTAEEILTTLFFSNTPIGNSGQMCGGIAALPCPSGFTCQLDGNYPDAGGTCVMATGTKYSCPPNGYIDCMPGPGVDKSFQCSKEAQSWYQTNCPDFQGVAY